MPDPQHPEPQRPQEPQRDPQPPEARHEVVLYTRAGCGLCEHAKAAIAQARQQVAFAYREVDIDGDPQLFAAHRYDIPVVEVDGRRAFKHRLAAAALLERLRR